MAFVSRTSMEAINAAKKQLAFSSSVSSSSLCLRRLISWKGNAECAATQGSTSAAPLVDMHAFRRHELSTSASASASGQSPPQSSRPAESVSLARWMKNVVVEGFGAEEVGNDGKNVYFRRQETNADGMPVEKRWMRYSTSSGLYCPEEVPSEWHGWLNFLRSDPPTAVEIEENETRRRETKLRAKALERDELQRKLSSSSLLQSASQDGEDAYSETTGSALLHRLRATASDEMQEREKTADRATDHGTTGGASFQPNAWRPGGK